MFIKQKIELKRLIYYPEIYLLFSKAFNYEQAQ